MHEKFAFGYVQVCVQESKRENGSGEMQDSCKLIT